MYSTLSGVPYTDYELEMIDITQDPVKAQQSGVTMSPALIYHSSEGDKRILHVTRAEVRRLLGIEEESLNI
ncbi:MAG: hypothetical protein K2X29_13015 [Candidatus Obscuribacterales bacterium]|nr:hypothetical protein [Candidatus Obscuribacterales bacterium]